MLMDRTTKKTPPELMLLLECTKGPAVEKGNLHNLLAQPIDWGKFLHLAEHHRVFPLVYRTLSEISHPAVPVAALETLQKNTRHNTFKAVAQTAETVKIAKLFTEKGIKFLVLKGSPLALKLYGEISLRPAKDIDILVEPQDLRKAGAILEEAGYQHYRAGLPTTPRQTKGYLEKAKHVCYFHPGHKVYVELHWKIHQVQLKFDALSELRTNTIEIAGCPVPVLTNEEWLLFLMLHGCNHRWFRLRWLCDIERFIKDPDLDWAKVILLARQAGLSTVLHQSVVLAEELLSLPVAKQFRPYVDKDKKAQKLAQMVIEQLCHNTSGVTGAGTSYIRNFLITYNYHVKLRSGWQNKLAYTFSIYRPTSADFQLVPLPDGLYPLYYVLRPFTWLWRRIRMARGIGQ